MHVISLAPFVRAVIALILLISVRGNEFASAQIDIGAGLRADRSVRSLKDIRDGGLFRQQLDYSCGAAALATLLHFGFGEEVTEGDVLLEIFERLREEERDLREVAGFSLLDLRAVAEARGYDAQGFRLRSDQLSMLGGPVIVFVEPRGYAHFAVLRGVRGGRVYLADPSRGNVRMPLYRFLDEWLQDDGQGIIFVAEPRDRADIESTFPVLPATPRRPELMTVREMLAVGNAIGHR